VQGGALCIAGPPLRAGTGQLHPTSYAFAEITGLPGSGKIDWRYYCGKTAGAADGGVADVDSDETTYTFRNPLPAFPVVKNDPTQFRPPHQRDSMRTLRNGTLPLVSWAGKWRGAGEARQFRTSTNFCAEA